MKHILFVVLLSPLLFTGLVTRLLWGGLCAGWSLGADFACWLMEKAP